MEYGFAGGQVSRNDRMDAFVPLLYYYACTIIFPRYVCNQSNYLGSLSGVLLISRCPFLDGSLQVVLGLFLGQALAWH